jgi:hypothetical protein
MLLEHVIIDKGWWNVTAFIVKERSTQISHPRAVQPATCYSLALWLMQTRNAVLEWIQYEFT